MNRRSSLGTLATMDAAATSPTMSNGMLYRILGKTGEKVSAIALGRYYPEHPRTRRTRSGSSAELSIVESHSWPIVGIITAVKANDAWDCAARRLPAEGFLMTKFDGRTKDASTRQINESCSVC
jgi:hypothetical protein